MHREMLGEMASDMAYAGKVFHNALFTGEEEMFASKRCVSRLMEMRSPLYRLTAHAPGLAMCGLDPSCLEFDAAPGGKGSGAAQSAAPPAGPAKSKMPKFGQKHFWGKGWWEKLIPFRQQQSTSG